MTNLDRIAPARKKKSRRLRREMTEAELRLWRQLRYRQLGEYKFRRQHPLGRYVLDFVCLEARLAVEVDGGQHLEAGRLVRISNGHNGWRLEAFAFCAFGIMKL